MSERKSTDRLPAVPHAGATAPCTSYMRRRDDGLIILTIGGQASSTLAMRVRNQLLLEGIAIEASDLLIDASDLEKYDGEFAGPIVDILKEYKVRGGGRVMFVAHRQNIRMMIEGINVSSIAGDGPQIDNVDVLGVAIAKLGRTIDGVA